MIKLQVKTREAAEIAGVGYEGFRSWLKRGMMKATGTLPKFYASHVAAEEADAKRWQWAAFGFSDLCCFRLAKILFDAGLPWKTVNPIVSNDALWHSHHQEGTQLRYVVVFDDGMQWTPYTTEELAADLTFDVLAKCERMTIVNLDHLRRDVLARAGKLAA